MGLSTKIRNLVAGGLAAIIIAASSPATAQPEIPKDSGRRGDLAIGYNVESFEGEAYHGGQISGRFRLSDRLPDFLYGSAGAALVYDREHGEKEGRLLFRPKLGAYFAINDKTLPGFGITADMLSFAIGKDRFAWTPSAGLRISMMFKDDKEKDYIAAYCHGYAGRSFPGKELGGAECGMGVNF